MNAARGALALIALLGIVALACSSSATGSSLDDNAHDAASPCSNGPPIPEGTRLPGVPRKNAAGPCTPRCGAENAKHTTAGFYLLAALPSGACNDEPICTMGVYDGCGHQGAQCECVDGEWSCGIAMTARVACVDASAD